MSKARGIIGLSVKNLTDRQLTIIPCSIKFECNNLYYTAEDNYNYNILPNETWMFPLKAEAERYGSAYNLDRDIIFNIPQSPQVEWRAISLSEFTGGADSIWELDLAKYVIEEEKSYKLDFEALGATSNSIKTITFASGINAGTTAEVISVSPYIWPITETQKSYANLNFKEKSFKDKGLCPECGHSGEWRMLSLWCPKHGKFAG